MAEKDIAHVREKWFRNYDVKLSNLEKTILQLLSVFFEPITKTSLFNGLRHLHYRLPTGKPITQPQLDDIIRDLERGDFVLQLKNGFSCPSEYTEVLSSIAVAEGNFNRFALAVQKVKPLRVSCKQTCVFSSYDEGIREVRIELYRGNYEQVLQLLAQIATTYGSMFLKRHPLAVVFEYVLDLNWLFQLPDELLLDGLFIPLNRSVLELEPANAHFELLLNYLEFKGKNCEQVLEVLALQHLLRGQFEQVYDLYRERETYISSSLLGSLILIKGNVQNALLFFDEAINLHYQQQLDERAFFSGISGVFYMVALLQSNDESSLARADELFQGAIKKSPNWLSGTYAVLEQVHAFQSGKRVDVHNLSNWLSEKGSNSIERLFRGLAACWIAPDAIANMKTCLEDLHYRATTCGYKWLSAEAAEILIRGGAKKKFGMRADNFWKERNSQSLADLIRPKTQWERTLEALLQLRPAETQALPQRENSNEERLVWWITPMGKRYEIEPRLQKWNGKGGWTKGRPISLSRLEQEAAEFDFLTDQDRRICEAINSEPNQSYNRASHSREYYSLSQEQAFLELIGHPLIFWGNAPNPQIELVKGNPSLRVLQERNYIYLRLEPEIHEKNNTILVKESPTRLRLIQVIEQHRLLGKILGKGLRVPIEGKERVMEVIGAIAPLVTVNSDIGVQNEEVATVEADARTVVHLLPFGEGLKMEVMVQPFSEQGPRFRPGEGGEAVFTRIAHKAVQTLRDLELERHYADKVIDACTILERIPETNGEWLIEGLDDCLELLVELQDVSDIAVIKWPEGEKFHIRKRVSCQQLKLQVTGQNDWFQVDGSLTVDEYLVIELQNLLRLTEIHSGHFLKLDDGQFLALSKDLRRRLDDLHSFSEADGQCRRFHTSATFAMENIFEGLEDLETDARWQEHCRRIHQIEEMHFEIPFTFQARLRDYQIDGFRWLARMAHWRLGACLADEMGLGKTLQALALLLMRAPDGPSLIIAPTSVCPNWEAETQRFAPTLNIYNFGGRQRQEMLDDLKAFDILICSYGLLQQESEILSQISWNTIVLDEAQAIKNMATKRSHAAMQLQGDCKIITTGTPIENHLGELWNLFRFLNPGLLATWERFQQVFANPIERDRDRSARSRLKRLIKPFILRRRKQDVLDELPPRTEMILHVELSSAEKALYEALRQKALSSLSNNDIPVGQKNLQILAEITRLRRACCHPRLILPDSDIPSSKLELFGEVMTELLANHHRVLVFSQFVTHLDILRGLLDELKISYQYLDGNTPPRERKKRIDAFQAGRSDAFLISLKAGGFGINLTAADYVLHMDPWWNPAVEDQASDRAHRIGQIRPVTVYRLVTKGTIEEKIVQLHQQKRELAESLLDGSDISGKMSTEDLLNLIREG